MDVIIRINSEKTYKLVACDLSKIVPTEDLDREEIHTKIFQATPVSPSSWKEIWLTIIPHQEDQHISDSAIKTEIAELIYMQVFTLKDCNKLNDFSHQTPLSQGKKVVSNLQTLSNTPIEGHGVSMINGEVFLKIKDVGLPGPIPFDFHRVYRSSAGTNKGMGVGWNHSGNEFLEINENAIYFYDHESRVIHFDSLETGESAKYLPDDMSLKRTSESEFLLFQENQFLKVFTQANDLSRRFNLTQIRQDSCFYPNETSLNRHDEPCFTINFSHDNQHNVLRIAGSWGNSITLVRNEKGWIKSITLNNDSLELSRTVASYKYDENGCLTEHVNPAKFKENYEYSHLLLHIRRLANGYQHYYRWNGKTNNANCVACWGDDKKQHYVFEWNLSTFRNKTTDSRNFSRLYHFNDLGQLVEKIDADEGIHWYTYRNGKKHSYTNPLGHKTHYFYDNDDFPAGIRDSLGQELIVNYFAGRLTQVVQKDGSHWRWQYNKKGELIAEIDAYNQVTHYSYNKYGLLASNTDPQGKTIRYVWSTRGELLEVEESSGFKQIFTYTPWGELNSETTLHNGKKNGAKTLVEYHSTGAVKKLTTADGHSHEYHYNALEKIVAYNNTHGQSYKFVYYKFGKLAKRIDPTGKSVKFFYDSELNLIAVKNEHDEILRFTYTALGKIKKERGFDGREQQYAYDQAGNLIKHLDAEEVLTAFKYDGLGRPITKVCKHIRNRSIPTRKYRFKYDAMNRLIEIYDTSQFIRFEYNYLGNVNRESHYKINDELKLEKESRKSTTFYNIWPGLLSGFMLPDGQRIDYRYDEHLHYTDIQHNRTTLLHIERDSFGFIRENHQGALLTQFRYDQLGRLIKQNSFNQERFEKGPIVRNFYYDNRNLLVKTKENSIEKTFQYDLLDRLIEAKHVYTQEKQPAKVKQRIEKLNFDALGNLLSQQAGVPGICQGGKLIIQGDREFTFDARGNLIMEKKGDSPPDVTHFEFNLENQLIKISRNNQITEYKYDPLGRRIEKRDAFGVTRFFMGWFSARARNKKCDKENLYLCAASSQTRGNDYGRLPIFLSSQCQSSSSRNNQRCRRLSMEM